MGIKKIKLFMIFFIIILLESQIFNNFLIKSSLQIKSYDRIPFLADITQTKQWIQNSDFTNQQYWYSSIQGDPSDVNASIDEGQANYKILGDSRQFEISGSPYGSDWLNFTNPSFPGLPDNYTITQAGWLVQHKWFVDKNESLPVSVQWKKNITMPVKMLDYEILSCSLQVQVNGTVRDNPTQNGGIDVPGDDVESGSMYDFARFYVLISDLNNEKKYEMAYFKTRFLGKDNFVSDFDSLNNTSMNIQPEDILISYLTSVLHTDYFNFTLIVGVDIYCERNHPGDIDIWNELHIKSLNLSFNYQKKMDQFTSVSWNQEGAIPSELSNNTIFVNDALLNFKYKINDTWPMLSPNSEIRILVNNVPHSETIKLFHANASFQKAKLGGFNIKSLIDENKNVNLSIQVYLADEFELNRNIKISIDEVLLYITYTEIIENPSGTDWSWLVYSLIGVIIGLVIIFGLYQLHFKYPPIVRKIRSLKKKIRKGKTHAPLLLANREDIIWNHLQKKLEILKLDNINQKKSGLYIKSI
ncbi:MAG: hypothetical protein ACFE9S_15765 [Candidatus Hermodarchaeota archaeon]